MDKEKTVCHKQKGTRVCFSRSNGEYTHENRFHELSSEFYSREEFDSIKVHYPSDD